MENNSELIEKYKDEVVNFEYYYKYVFTFENEKISIDFGGGSNIYRADIIKTMTVKKIIEQCGDEYLFIREK